MQSVESLVETISKQSGKPPEEVKKLIEEKQDELSGLVSEEGAAYIVGRELGAVLIKQGSRQLKVKNLTSGLRSVDIMVRVSQVFEPREFERNGKQGKVKNLMVGDETGLVRFSFWNDEIERISELKEGDVIRLTRGYVKMDNRGNPELRLGKGKIETVSEKIDLPEPKDLKSMSAAKKSSIKDLKEGDIGEVRACLVQLFRRNPFYEVCPECGTRMRDKDGKLSCKDHGEAQPEYRMVMSGVIDDGTGNIRAVFFGETAEKLIGKPAKELHEQAQKQMDVNIIYDSFKKVGRDMVFTGRVKKNDLTENIEMVVNDISEVDIKKECERLAKSLE